jgi:hypothetical protein
MFDSQDANDNDQTEKDLVNNKNKALADTNSPCPFSKLSKVRNFVITIFLIN